MVGFIKRLSYYLTAKFWHKYNIVKPRKLDHNFVDRDHLLAHVIFEVLCNFVEKELLSHAGRQIDWESDPETKNAKNTMLELYNWWKTYDYDWVYNLTNEQFDKVYPWDIPTDKSKQEINSMRSARMFEADQKYQQLLRDNCKKIVDVSPYMWT